MSYTKQNFKSGEKLYASDLNEMDEQLYQNTESISQLSEDKADKENTYTKAEVDGIVQNLPSGEGGANLDVQINGKSIVENGVATIPMASKDAFGVAKIYSSGDKNAPGVGMSGNNILTIVQATNANIDGRVSQKTIASGNIDYAVKCAMTDGKGAEWTDAERLSALLRLGCTVDDDGFVKWTAKGE